MKSILKKLVLPVVIICLVLCLPQTAEASGTFRTTAGVHVRSEASKESKSLMAVSKGTGVDVIEHDPAGWSRVIADGVTGYIRSDFLLVSTGGGAVSMNTTAGVHVRSEASTASKSLTSVSAGTSVEVTEHDPAGWSVVRVDGVTGYIRSDFLKHAATASAPSESNTPADAAAGQTDAPNQPDEPDTVIEQLKTLSNVNLRTEASQQSGIIKVVPKDTTVDVLKNESTGWSKVRVGDAQGYIKSEFLAPLSMPQQSVRTLYTAGEDINMRTGASTSSSIIKTLDKAVPVAVIDEDAGGWLKVTHGNSTGYIKADLLTSSEYGDKQTRYTNDNVNLRTSAAILSANIIKTLAKGTAVTVIGEQGEWSNVIHNESTGYVKSEFLSLEPTATGQVIAIRKTIGEGVRVRSGPSTSTSRLATLAAGTSVDVLADEPSGWSRVRVGSISGYIRSDLLFSGASVELVTMAEVSGVLPYRRDIRVVDVRTGTSFNIRIFSKGLHADYDFPTRADTNAMFSTRNGVRSWAARPVWVFVGDRVFAAATHGMPHDVSMVKDNGVDGHLCLHFKDTITNSKSYQEDLRAAVLEAYNKRPQ